MSNKSKIIITNRSDLEDDECLERVLEIIKDGKISMTANRAHYCHLTKYKDGIIIASYCRNPDVFTFEIDIDL